MSQEAAVRPYQHLQPNADADLKRLLSQPKPTFAALDKAITEAAESVDLTDPFRAAANEALKNQLFLSPRLQHWQLSVAKDGVAGYWLKNSDQTATVTVSEGRVTLQCPDPSQPKCPFSYTVITGIPATTLFKSIQDAQAIVFSHTNSSEEPIDYLGDEYFQPGDAPYLRGADLDAALEETHANPLVEDDAELIQDIAAEEALNRDQQQEDGPAPIVTVNQKFIESISENGEIHTPVGFLKAETFTEKTNRKNASTDGVQCELCGNLNRDAYRGKCPQCPKMMSVRQQPEKDGIVLNTAFISNLKSLQGRILTIVDGSFADKTQREAVKTLINKEFRREMGKITGDSQ
jgi:hypothetical protein